MWFQGRDDDIAEEVRVTAAAKFSTAAAAAALTTLAAATPQVVSLSTGRIFRATSSDGLRWEIEK